MAEMSGRSRYRLINGFDGYSARQSTARSIRERRLPVQTMFQEAAPLIQQNRSLWKLRITTRPVIRTEGRKPVQ